MSQEDYARGYEHALLEKKGEIDRLTERLNKRYATLEEYVESLEIAFSQVCEENERLQLLTTRVSPTSVLSA